jgi:hypothetical protein
MISTFYQSESAKIYISKLINSVALYPNLQRKLFFYIEEFYGFECLINKRYSIEEKQNFAYSLLLFVISYKNSLLIVDTEDFAKENILS